METCTQHDRQSDEGLHRVNAGGRGEHFHPPDAAATSATAAQAAQSAAETALSTFVNRYLGSYTNVAGNDTEVTTAKSSVIDAGDIYFDGTNTVLRYFDGSSWHPAAATQSPKHD